MQDEPFADDVLVTLQFMTSVITQYRASHKRCFTGCKLGLGTQNGPHPSTLIIYRIPPAHQDPAWLKLMYEKK